MGEGMTGREWTAQESGSLRRAKTGSGVQAETELLGKLTRSRDCPLLPQCSLPAAKIDVPVFQGYLRSWSLAQPPVSTIWLNAPSYRDCEEAEPALAKTECLDGQGPTL